MRRVHFVSLPLLEEMEAGFNWTKSGELDYVFSAEGELRYWNSPKKIVPINQ